MIGSTVIGAWFGLFPLTHQTVPLKIRGPSLTSAKIHAWSRYVVTANREQLELGFGFWGMFDRNGD